MKRRIAIVNASPNDLGQCYLGLQLLQSARASGEVEIIEPCWAASIHRATMFVLALIGSYHSMSEPPMVIITGAGWANHLSGVIDAWLRYFCRNDKIVVIGVAFGDYTTESQEEAAAHNAAAISSMTEVPGTQLVYKDQDGVFFSLGGYLRACRFAAYADLPTITLPKPRPEAPYVLDQMTEHASNLYLKLPEHVRADVA